MEVQETEPTTSAPISHCLELQDFVLKKDIGVRAATSVTCSLSIIGSLMIIFSYILFRNLRTRARYILVHLSITDLVLAVSNLVGVVSSSDISGLDPSSNKLANRSHKIDDSILCKVQGFLTLYSTISSVLWTILLAILVFILVTAGTPKRITKFLMRFCYALCYGLPLLPSLWALLTGLVGYAPLQAAGWCTLKSHQVYLVENVYCAEINVYANILGYNLWIVMAFVVISVTYFSIHCHITNKVRQPACFFFFTEIDNQNSLGLLFNTVNRNIIDVSLILCWTHSTYHTL